MRCLPRVCCPEADSEEVSLGVPSPGGTGGKLAATVGSPQSGPRRQELGGSTGKAQEGSAPSYLFTLKLSSLSKWALTTASTVALLLCCELLVLQGAHSAPAQHH